jgi:hypothetical protein
LKNKRRFGEIFPLYLQGLRMSQAKKNSWACDMFHAWLILRIWRWRRYLPPTEYTALYSRW